VNGGDWTPGRSVPAVPDVGRAFSWGQPDLTDGNLYEYRVDASNPAGVSQSAILWITRRAPAPPHSLRFSDVGHNSVRLHWTAGSPDQDRFLVSRVGGGGSPTSTTATSLQIGSLSPDTRYCFNVWAVNSYGSSGEANACVSTAPRPVTTETRLLAMNRYITAGGTVYYYGSTPIAGTLQRIHVPTQLHVNSVLFLKPGVSGEECRNPRATNVVGVNAGDDLNIAALLGTPHPTVNGLSLASCALLSGNYVVQRVVANVTYTY
jgi:Fibronectin type III domain